MIWSGTFPVRSDQHTFKKKASSSSLLREGKEEQRRKKKKRRKKEPAGWKGRKESAAVDVC